MKLVNLTPHVVNLPGITLAPTGIVARVAQTRVVVGTLNGIPVMRSVFGAVTDLPDVDAGTVFIVSRMVADAAKDRNDLMFPDDLVRDNDGRIIGANALGRI